MIPTFRSSIEFCRTVVLCAGLPILLVVLDALIRRRVVASFSGEEWACYAASVVLMAGGYWLVLLGLGWLRSRFGRVYGVVMALVAVIGVGTVGAGYAAYAANGDLPDLFLLSYIRCETENALILFRDSFRWQQAVALVAGVWAVGWCLHRSCRPGGVPGAGRRVFWTMVVLCWGALWYCWTGTVARGQCFVPLVRIPLVMGMYVQNEIKGINPKPIRLPAREPLEIAGKLPPPPCSVLVILNESLRRQNLGIYGHSRNTTPFMTDFAAGNPDGFFKFERAYANSTTTLLSVPSILTGISPLQPLAYRVKAPLVWQWARAAGMESFFFTSHDLAWCDIGRFITTPGPDKIWEQRHEMLPHYRDLGSDDHITVERAVAHLDPLARSGRPFFGVVHLNTNHYPYNTRDEYRRWRGGDIDLYDNTILETDAHTRRLIETLAAAGALERTVVLFASDHGEGFNEHGYIAHFYCHYTETVSVPMWFYLPPVMTRGRDLAALRRNLAAPVQNLDLLPTLLDCIGAWDHAPAAPFREVMLGSSLLRPVPDGRTLWITNTDETIASVIGLSSIRGSRHYILGTSGTPAKEELFDLDADPGEKNNLWPGVTAAERDEIRGSFLVYPVAARMMRGAFPGWRPGGR